MSTWIAIAVGGATGALARHAVDVTVTNRIGTVPGAFPWGTLAINVAGSFVLGIVFVLLVEPASGPEWLRDTMTAGFLSSFTTYSTFSVQTVVLAEAGRPGLAVGYVVASLILGILAAALAILASRISPVFGWTGGLIAVAVSVIAFTRAR